MRRCRLHSPDIMDFATVSESGVTYPADRLEPPQSKRQERRDSFALSDAICAAHRILKNSLALCIPSAESLSSVEAIVLEPNMPQTHQAKVELSQLDLSDWRKRINQLKQELRANNPRQNPLLTAPPLTYGSQPSPHPSGRRVPTT